MAWSYSKRPTVSRKMRFSSGLRRNASLGLAGPSFGEQLAEDEDLHRLGLRVQFELPTDAQSVKLGHENLGDQEAGTEASYLERR